ncbi:squamous-cell carcinoma T-cell-recognized antigen [Salpingoeca rosetta]|uniref:Squamous-cell carcinoma T-cell-recognized antigen n=1 Tax=Salpingoeca rosetta (strain ATCC 50818 / BSB-021) TaxID=946362 RepID=F2UF46_SALR5|nr:squamous-cell carcinoma T-cell-recognized antigen [Salpingoeca rosetta]EGD75246.1 squamous-cell carcinoma T-cell-recognized antigen [Salpingoeca rosetta]|eukprot:XP_004992299.1 squamous-cell carcinoma T-cell-recognized antigen [Salpingoeca rosetta]
MSSAEEISLNVEESNALRAKLGLAPLRGDDEPREAKPGQSSMETDVLLAPVVPGEKQREAELRDKLKERKEKRSVEAKLRSVKTLGEADDDDDSAAAWVKRSRAKKQAQRQAKMLQDMDEQLTGSSSASASAGGSSRKRKGSKNPTIKQEEYTSTDLRGMTVRHDLDQFQEGAQTILTLEDRGVLDDDEEDVLVNVNIAEDEHAKRRVAEAQRSGGYDPKRGLDDDDEDTLLGLKKKSVLDKYDDIDSLTGDKKLKETKTFRIGFEDEKSSEEQRKEEVRQRLLQAESLEFKHNAVSDFYTEEEMEKFKKKRKKRKAKGRKKTRRVRADDLLGLDDEEEQTQPEAEGDTMETGADVSHAVRDEEDILNQANDAELEAAERELEAELQASLTRARRARKNAYKKKDVTELLDAAVKKSKENNNGSSAGGGVVFSTMSEFVRGIGANSKDDDQPRKRNKQGSSSSATATATAGATETSAPPVPAAPASSSSSASSAAAAAMETGEDKAEEGGDGDGTGRYFQSSFTTDQATTDAEHAERKTEVDDTPVLGEEGNVGSSVTAALNLALRKGYLAQKKKKQQQQQEEATASRLAELTSKNAQQEEHGPEDDDHGRDSRSSRDWRRDSRRDRDRGDPFEKRGYQPSFRLSYTDNTGRELTPKEAFTYMSHQFHGKTSGRMKTEKKLRKRQQEEALLKMSSEDTPLGSVVGLRKHQEQTGKAHIVLSGSQK